MSSWHKTSQQTLPVPVTLIPCHDWWLYLELWARINTSSNKLPLLEFFITTTEKAATVVRQVKYVLVPTAWSVFPSSRSNTFFSKANQKLPLKVFIKIIKPRANEATASFWSFKMVERAMELGVNDFTKVCWKCIRRPFNMAQGVTFVLGILYHKSHQWSELVYT